MIAASLWSWFGVGLFFFANASRLWHLLRLVISRRARWLLRFVGFAALAACVLSSASEASGALALVGALLVVMAISSVAVLLAPLYPRSYAVSTVVAGLLAAADWLRG